MTAEPHAITRARERYGLECGPKDLRLIVRRCRRGGETIMRAERKAGADVFILRYRGVVIIPLIAFTDTVVTFFSLTTYSAAVARAARKEKDRRRPRKPKKTRDRD